MKNGAVIRLDDHSAKLIELLGERARVALEAIGTRAEKYAKQALTNSMNEGIDLTQHGEADNSRVDTGRLRNSVTHAIADNGTEKAVYIGTNVPYAPYHEFGTGIYATSGGGRRTAWWYQGRDGQYHKTVGLYPLHFLRNAVQNHLDEYQQVIQSVFDQLNG